MIWSLFLLSSHLFLSLIAYLFNGMPQPWAADFTGCRTKNSYHAQTTAYIWLMRLVFIEPWHYLFAGCSSKALIPQHCVVAVLPGRGATLITWACWELGSPSKPPCSCTSTLTRISQTLLPSWKSRLATKTFLGPTFLLFHFCKYFISSSNGISGASHFYAHSTNAKSLHGQQ